MNDNNEALIDKTIEVNGITVCYNDLGEGTIPIIFIHGFPFDKSTWQPQMDFFKKAHRVIAYDIRGFGKSAVGREIVSMNLFADDLIAFMDALEIKRAIVCGLSMGGYVLLNVKNELRNRFKAMILCDTQCIADSEELKEKRNRTIAQVIAGRKDDFAQQFVENALCKQTTSAKNGLPEKVKEVILATLTESITGGLSALARRQDMCASLSEFQIPVLIICGAEDIITPTVQAELLHRNISNSALRIIDRAGHLSNLEQPDEFNRHLSGFIDGLTK